MSATRRTPFSLGDVIRAAAMPHATNESFEAVVDYTARMRAAGLDPIGHCIPWAVLTERTGLATTDIAAPVQPDEFAPLLRNLSVLGRAGATFHPLAGHRAAVPRQDGTATVAWVGENPGSDVSRSNMTTSLVNLAFKTAQATTAVSRQAVFSAQGGSFDLDTIIRNDLGAAIAIAIDLAGANGLGASNQPLGVLQDTAVATLSLGSNGAVFDRIAATKLEKAVADANADASDSLAFVATPAVRAKARNTPDFTGGSEPLWRNDGTVIGYKALSTNQLPPNLTKGTSTTVCSAIIFGAWEHLLIGVFGGGLDVQVDPYTLKNQNLLDITVRAYVDVANRRPLAFEKVVDAVTT